MRHEDLLDLHVAEIMSRWPATIGVFISFRMHCIGCPIGSFHTLVDAAEEHGIPLDKLAMQIAGVIAGASADVTPDAAAQADALSPAGRGHARY